MVDSEQAALEAAHRLSKLLTALQAALEPALRDAPHELGSLELARLNSTLAHAATAVVGALCQAQGLPADHSALKADLVRECECRLHACS